MGSGRVDRVLARVSNTSCELIDQQPWSLGYLAMQNFGLALLLMNLA